MTENAAMLKMCHDFKFTVARDVYDSSLLFATLQMSQVPVSAEGAGK